MPEFLELIETLQAEHASVQRLFSGDGVGVRSLRETRGVTPEYTRRLIEATRLIADVVAGKKPAYLLREAMTTSDFPLLFGDVIDRQLLANYREWPSSWQTYCARKTVPDFREVDRFAITGGEAVLAGVPEMGPYPEAHLDEVRYHYHVGKYGRKLPISWEAIINDDLQALQDVPERFGRAARRTEDRFATVLHVDANGPHAGVYTNGNLNRIAVAAGGLSNNPALSIVGLQAGFYQIGKMLDADGEPIVIDAVILEVPPALEVTARNILNATQLWLNQNLAAGTATQDLVTENWMKNRTTLVVNPYIPLIATVANGNTSWFLHAAPTNGNPAFEMGFLRGHTEPEVFIKEPNARRVGGGVNPLDGDFDSDSVEYKVRHVMGGVVEEVKATVASTGGGGA